MPLELIVGAAIGAAASSSSVRKTVRGGLVYGVSRALIAYDRVAGFAHNRVGATAPAPSATPAPTSEAPASAAPAESPGTSSAPPPGPAGTPAH